MPLFGQILAALYQEDIVEEDDIRGWHILPSTSSGDGLEGVERDNFRKCWTIGTHMIQQFDDQDSSESDNEIEKPTPVTATAVIATKGEDEDDSDEASSEGTVPEGGEVSEDASEDVSASEECSTATSTNPSEDEDESEETSN